MALPKNAKYIGETRWIKNGEWVTAHEFHKSRTGYYVDGDRMVVLRDQSARVKTLEQFKSELEQYYLVDGSGVVECELLKEHLNPTPKKKSPYIHLYLPDEHREMLDTLIEQKPSSWKPSHLLQDAIEREYDALQQVAFLYDPNKNYLRVKKGSRVIVTFDLNLLDGEEDGVISGRDQITAEWSEITREEAEGAMNEHSHYGTELLEYHTRDLH